MQRPPDVGTGIELSSCVRLETKHKVELTTYAAFGYLLKDRLLDVEECSQTAELIAAGGSALDPEVISRLLARRRAIPADSLTERELTVPALMAEGLTNAGIAER